MFISPNNAGVVAIKCIKISTTNRRTDNMIPVFTWNPWGHCEYFQPDSDPCYLAANSLEINSWMRNHTYLHSAQIYKTGKQWLYSTALPSLSPGTSFSIIRGDAGSRQETPSSPSLPGPSAEITPRRGWETGDTQHRPAHGLCTAGKRPCQIRAFSWKVFVIWKLLLF